MPSAREFAPLCAALAAALAGAAGCSSGTKPDLDSPVPAARIEAIGEASTRHDPAEIRSLIAQLDSDDPAVRVFAIASLEKVTGQRRGYDPADPERTRREAADRWQEWYRQEYGVGPGDDRWKDSGGVGGGASGGGRGAGTGGGPAGHSP